MRKINKVIVHCAATPDVFDEKYTSYWVGAKQILHLHTSPKSLKIKWFKYDTHGKGFSNIGYHEIITRRGEIQPGRAIKQQGAHCLGENRDSIGICLVGTKEFTNNQIISLQVLFLKYKEKYNLKIEDWFCHNDFANKDCPGFDRKKLHEILEVAGIIGG